MIHSPLNRSFICYSIFIRFSPTFRFNVRVRPDSKRTVPKPFSKDNEKPSCDSPNYRPISLHNTLIKIYARVIYNRIVNFIQENTMRLFKQLTRRVDLLPSTFLFYMNWFLTTDSKRAAHAAVIISKKSCT